MIPLESLTSCFQGLIPSWLCTCSKDGIPNVAILSHVDYVDSRHVALSFQFFNKSKRNVMENPRALVRLCDPDTFQVYALKLRFVRTETEGPLFESMRLRIEAIASHSGAKGVFRLLGADVYEVLSVTRLEHEVGLPPEAAATSAAGPPTPDVLFTMRALQELSEGIHRATTLDCLLESILEGLERLFGFRNSMILLTSDKPDRLEMIASRGYPEGGVGSEVGFGEGIIGMVAETRKPIRISGMLRFMLYAYAASRAASERGLAVEDRRIPLPGLPNPDSQLGIPLLVRDELVGVLCIESDAPYRFHEEDRAYLEVLGGYLAIAIQNALLHERSEEASSEAGGIAASGDTAAVPPPPAPCDEATRSSLRPRIAVEYFKADECILVDGEYLVRGLPAKLLRKFLRERAATGPTEFTNRRLRLDRTLGLPEFKDNLESRLILLRRRLQERCPEIRLVQSGRGRFLLELGAEVELSERD
jgi:adenylate cyclase